MALIPRGIESELRDILSVSRAAAITGPRQVGIIIYSGEHTLPIGDRIWAVPISGLWR
jgi:hypothetical protein